MAVDELVASFQREAQEQRVRAQVAEEMVARLLDALDGVLDKHPPANPYVGDAMAEARALVSGGNRSGGES